jgi:glucose-6-phosphate isomerase
VEAGKKAAGGVIALQLKLTAALKAAPEKTFTAEELATAVGSPDSAELVFKILEHLAANKGRGVKKRAKTLWYKSTYRSA